MFKTALMALVSLLSLGCVTEEQKLLHFNQELEQGRKACSHHCQKSCIDYCQQHCHSEDCQHSCPTMCQELCPRSCQRLYGPDIIVIVAGANDFDGRTR